MCRDDSGPQKQENLDLRPVVALGSLWGTVRAPPPEGSLQMESQDRPRTGEGAEGTVLGQGPAL